MPLGIYGELPECSWNQEVPGIFLKLLHLQHIVKECHPVVSCFTCTEQGSISSTAGRHFISDKALHFGKQMKRRMSFPVSQYRVIRKHALMSNTSYIFKYRQISNTL
jgi:hypothetical protein